MNQTVEFAAAEPPQQQLEETPPHRRFHSAFALRADATVVPVGAHVRGDIDCGDIMIHGKVTGFVRASGRVLVNVGGEVCGGISAGAEVVIAGRVLQLGHVRAAIISKSAVILTHSSEVIGDIRAARVTAWRDEVDSTHARVRGRFLPLLG